MNPVHALLQESERTLGAAGVERPRWTAEQIAASVLQCEPIALAAALRSRTPVDESNQREVAPRAVTPDDVEDIRRRVGWRAIGIPLQHVTGVAGFFGLDFMVAPWVFIPRPETERVVEVALEEARRLTGGSGERRPDHGPLASRPVVMDVGTGSGAIVISLTASGCVGTMYGFDFSRQALTVARENARRLGAAARIAWVQADLLASCPPACADLVVANLPYIPTSALPALPREVQYDPVLALDGGPDGLSVIRRLAGQAASRLRPRGILVLEVGAGHAEIIRASIGRTWAECDIINDDTGLARVVVLRGPTTTRG